MYAGHTIVGTEEISVFDTSNHFPATAPILVSHEIHDVTLPFHRKAAKRFRENAVYYVELRSYVDEPRDRGKRAYRKILAQRAPLQQHHYGKLAIRVKYRSMTKIIRVDAIGAGEVEVMFLRQAKGAAEVVNEDDEPFVSLMRQRPIFFGHVAGLNTSLCQAADRDVLNVYGVVRAVVSFLGFEDLARAPDGNDERETQLPWPATGRSERL